MEKDAIIGNKTPPTLLMGSKKVGKNELDSLMNPKARKGFTLIEILVVVTIIGILASITLLGLGPARRSAADARRIANIKNVQSVLEVYFNREGFYPKIAAGTTIGEAQTNYDGLDNLASSPLVTTGIIAQNSLPNDVVTVKEYSYQSDLDGRSYYMGVFLDNPRPTALTQATPPAGTYVAMIAYCTSASSTTRGYPYCVTAP